MNQEYLFRSKSCRAQMRASAMEFRAQTSPHNRAGFDHRVNVAVANLVNAKNYNRLARDYKEMAK